MTIDPLAESILLELSRRPGSDQIVLGGYFALRHYIDYRTTHDIDAWWKARADVQTQTAIRDAMKAVADKQQLILSERRFGETVSFELSQGKSKVFSFQIAVRSVELEPPQASAWPPILIETLTDNVASKMNALVDRGSPRDFMDIHQVVTAGLMKPELCWTLWERKNPGESKDSAKQKVLLHIAALEQRRPLSSIADESDRERASTVRALVSRGVLQTMSLEIDQSVYPDLDHPPTALQTPEDQADYIHRICSAWDFGVHPDQATFDLFSQFREVFDRFPIITSPGYHAFRAWFGWPMMEVSAGLPAPTPRWVHLDRLENRPTDPCEQMI